MDVGMVEDLLGPSVQDREKSDSGAQVSGVESDFLKGFGNGLEEEINDVARCCAKEGMQRLGDGEDDVEVRDRKKISLLTLDPSSSLERLTLRTVPVPAGVVGDLPVAAAITLTDMTPERGRPAAQDCPYHARLLAAEGAQLADVLAEDIGNVWFCTPPAARMDRGAGHGYSLWAASAPGTASASRGLRVSER
jgi:hypothetical protein